MCSVKLKRTLPGLENFPENIVDIWPDHRNQEELLQSLKNCLPSENSKCRQRMKDGSTTQQIGILRPPGLLGDVFEEFVIEFVEMSRTDDTDMVLVSTSHVLEKGEHTFTKILRPAVLPLLLGAVDLALETVGDDFSSSEIIVDDLVGVVRQLMRWHCRLSRIADDTALFTVTFDRMVAYPMKAEKDLVEFLELSHEDQSDIHVDMEKLAEKVFHRIDACTAFLMQLNEAQLIELVVKQVIHDELNSGRCHSDPLLAESIGSSRVVEIVGHFLGGNPASADRICSKFPKAAVCIRAGKP